MSNEQSPSTSELESTVLDSLANHQPDTTLVKTLVGESMGERNVSEDADADELLSAYENWAHAVGELKLAEDTYYNADMESEEAEEAEQEKMRLKAKRLAMPMTSNAHCAPTLAANVNRYF